MNDQELTKIIRPETEGLVSRHRLFDLLGSHEKRRITWISSPAGSGKTSLIATYTKHEGLPTLWLRLDEGERDAATFFYMFNRAVEIAFPDIEKPLPSFTPGNLLDLVSFCTYLFSELAQKLPKSLIMVIDDYHWIATDSPVHQILKYLFLNGPAGWKIFVASREGIPPDLITLLVKNELQFIEWNQIQFNREESLALIGSKNLNLSTADMEKITLFSNGWAAALIILSQWRVELRKVEGIPRTNIDHLFHYIAGEVYNSLDDSMKKAILALSLFEEFDETRARKLIGLEQASHFFNRLNHQNLFFEEYNTSGNVTYRFHRLLRDYFQFVCEKTFSPSELRDLHARAAEIQIESGEYDHAICQYLNSKDEETAYRLILQYANHFVMAGRYKTLQYLLDQFPEENYRNDPWFICYQALAIQPYDQTRARELFTRAFDLFQERNDVTGMLEAWSRIFITIHYEWNTLYSLKPRVEWMKSNLHLLENTDSNLRLSVYTALLYWEIMIAGLSSHLRELSIAILKEYNDANDPALKLLSLVQLAVYTATIHPAHIPFSTLEAMIQAGDTINNHPLAQITYVYIRMILIGGKNTNLDALYENAQKGIELTEKYGITNWKDVFLGLQIGACIFRKDEKEALKLLMAMETDVRSGNIYLKKLYYSLRARVALAFEPDGFSPLEDKQMCLENYDHTADSLFSVSNHFLSAAVEFRYGDPRKAFSFQERGDRAARNYGSKPHRYTSLLVRSYIYLKIKDRKMAKRHLKTALQYARRYNYSLTFWWWDLRMMSELMIVALDEKLEVPTAIRIIRDLNLEIPDGQNTPVDWPHPIVIRTFGDFAIEVQGRPLSFSSKKQQKQIALLHAIIALGTKSVPLESIADALWPDSRGDAALTNLETTIHRLRKMIGIPGFLIIQDGKISINRNISRIDILDFLDCLQKADCPAQRVLELYRGPFLASFKESFIFPMRESLQNRFKFFLLDRGSFLEKSEKIMEAIDLYRSGFEIIPDDKGLAKVFLRACEAQGIPVDTDKLSEEIKLKRHLSGFSGSIGS